MYDEKYWTRGLWLYRIWFFILRHTFGIFIRLKYGFSCQKYKPQSKTFIAMSNHTSAQDQFFMSMALRGYIRYVANDDLLRKRLTGKLLMFFARPIPKRKSADHGETTAMILQNLRLGVNVGLYPEGNRSYNGESCFISPRTGRLVKEAGCGLVTFRVDGGYLQTPRWAKNPRKGKVWGVLAGEYTEKDLEALTADEINDIIRRDLYDNAFESQRKNPRPFTARDKAEYLETALYLCPKCRGLATMKSRGDDFFCACGYRVAVNDYGFFEGPDVIFDNCLDWDRWQREAYRALLLSEEEDPEAPVASDGGQTVISVEKGGNGKAVLTEDGTVTLYRDRIELRWEGGGRTLPMRAIGGVSASRMMNLLIAAGDDYFDIRSHSPRSPLKYLAAYRYLTGREYK